MHTPQREKYLQKAGCHKGSKAITLHLYITHISEKYKIYKTEEQLQTTKHLPQDARKQEETKNFASDDTM